MDPAQIQMLVQRLVADPHDENALALAHQAGTQDPHGYAMLLERVGQNSADEVFAAHWYNEAATVWESLGDLTQRNRLLYAAADKDPVNETVLERVAQLYREGGNMAALAQLLARTVTEAEAIIGEQPELRSLLLSSLEQLATLHAESNAEAALQWWTKLSQHDPQNLMAIYSARELLKAQARWAEAMPYFAKELAIIDDVDRKLALYRDAADVRRNMGDFAGATDSLRRASQHHPDDPQLTYELAQSIIDRIDSGNPVEPAERQEALQALVGLAETYDGEHGMTYARTALHAQPGDDRAMQLADYYAEQLGRQQELADEYRGYLGARPDGYMAEKAKALVGPAQPGAPSPSGVPSASATPGGSSAGGHGQPAAASYPMTSEAGQPAMSSNGYPAAQGAGAAAVSPEPAAAPELQGVAALLAEANDNAQRGRKPQAYQIYRRALEIEPANPEALGWVEDFLRQRRKYSDLRDVLLAASRVSSVSVETRKAQLRDVAGLCESKLRDFDTAIGAWKQICQIDRGDEQAREHLLGLLEKQRRWDEIAPLLEQQVMNEVDVEVQIALEKKVAALHEDKRNDPGAAAEAWVRIAALTPGDEDALMKAVGLFEQAERFDDAAKVVAENLQDVTEPAQRGLLFERLGELRTKLGDPGGAGDAYAEAAQLLDKDATWVLACEAYRGCERWADAADVTEKRAQLHDGADKAKILAEAGELLLTAGNPPAALLQLEAASELDPDNEDLATRVEEQYHQEGRHDEQVAFLLRRADHISDQAMRVGIRHRAVAIQRSLGDEAGARDSLQLVLQDGEDMTALQLLLDMVERSAEWNLAVDYLRRLTALCEGEDKLAYAVREAQVLADGLDDVDAAIIRYHDVLETLDSSNQYALHMLADLELRRDNPAGAAEALEQLIKLLEGEPQLEVARRLAPLYEGPLADAQAGMRVLGIIHRGDTEDFDAIERLKRLAEQLEDWPQVADFLGQLIEVEGDDEEASEMTRQLASILADRLDKGDEALGALEKLADAGNVACQQAYVDLGTQLGWKGIVATKLVAWNESVVGSSRAVALRQAFELFLEVERDADARTVALELARCKELDDELAHRLEEVTVKLQDLDALAVAHDLMGATMSGLERADEFVRQAGIMLRAGADALDAIHHGEVALSGIEPAQALELLPRLAELTQAPGHIIDLYERQVGRCKKPADRVAALACAAQVAAEHGAVDRARDFFNAALSGGVQEATLTALEEAARSADEAAGGDGRLLRTLAEALAAGGQGSRDGGRTRSALLRRAAVIAHRELADVDAAFAWIGDSIIAHVDDAALASLDELGAGVGDMKRVEGALDRALEEVFDGPLVRKLLRRRADLRRNELGDSHGAAGDLKRLHDLSPADQDLTKELSKLLTELRDHRGMIELYEDQILRGREPHVRAELARKVARLWEEEIGDGREAADAWRRVLRMKAGDKEAVAGLDRCKSGKLKKPPPVRHSEHPRVAVKRDAPEVAGPGADGEAGAAASGAGDDADAAAAGVGDDADAAAAGVGDDTDAAAAGVGEQTERTVSEAPAEVAEPSAQLAAEQYPADGPTDAYPQADAGIGGEASAPLAPGDLPADEQASSEPVEGDIDAAQAPAQYDAAQAQAQHDAAQAPAEYDATQAQPGYDAVQAPAQHDAPQAQAQHDAAQAPAQYDAPQAPAQHDAPQAPAQYDAEATADDDADVEQIDLDDADIEAVEIIEDDESDQGAPGAG